MITIALDESGTFETFGKKGRSKTLFIAGVVYDDKDNSDNKDDANDLINEKKRLNEYFKRVAEEVKCSYPNDLHVKRNKSNEDKVEIMKEEIKNSLPEFMKKGTYKGRTLVNDERKGEYRIACMLYNDKGKSIFKGDNICDLLREENISNLYINMAYSLLSRLAFHNPFNLDIETIKFDLATRTVKVKKNDDLLNRKYTDAGYKQYRFNQESRPKDIKDYNYYQIIDEHDYRSMISQKIIELNRTNLEINSLGVRSINYDMKANDCISMTFLYLSDVICSIFKSAVTSDKSVNNISDKIQSIYNMANSLTNSQDNLIFAYDDIDDIYERAIRSYQEKNYYKMILNLFESEESQSELINYYKNIWFFELEKSILSSNQNEEVIDKSEDILEFKDRVSIENAILEFSRYAQSNTLNQECLVHLCKYLEPLVERLDENNHYKYKFYDAGVTAYNHVGDSVTAEKYFKKCKEYSEFSYIEEYISTLNAHVVMLTDRYKYDEALLASKKIVKCQKLLLKQQGELFDSVNKKSTSYGKALSQLGQTYAYMSNKGADNEYAREAEQNFREALNHFEENTDNYYRTLSYLLHHYINTGNKTAYEEWSSKYFGGEIGIVQQVQYLMGIDEQQEQLQSFKFAMYVFIKGVYTFGTSQNKKIKKYILDQISAIKDSDQVKNMNGHPWELIYKYFALLAVKWDEKEKAAEFIEEMQTILKVKGEAIDNIIIRGLIDYYSLLIEEERVKEEEKEAAEKALEEVKGRFTDTNLKKEYDNLLVYMYK